MWKRIIVTHQQQAVEGEEPGGMVTGQHLEVERSLLREAVPLSRQYVEGHWKKLPSGPVFSTEEDTPPAYKDKVVTFVPEHVHTKLKEWVEMDPAADSEVLRIIQNKIHMRVPQDATGLRMKNGRAARENPGDLVQLMKKRLLNKSFRTASPEDLVNVLSLNLQPKPSADPP